MDKEFTLCCRQHYTSIITSISHLNISSLMFNYSIIKECKYYLYFMHVDTGAERQMIWVLTAHQEKTQTLEWMSPQPALFLSYNTAFLVWTQSLLWRDNSPDEHFILVEPIDFKWFSWVNTSTTPNFQLGTPFNSTYLPPFIWGHLAFQSEFLLYKSVNLDWIGN